MQQLKYISASLNRNLSYTIWFFIIFYLVGVAGITWELTFEFFTKLIPFALLLSFSALMIFDNRFSKRKLLVFAAIFIISFGVESIGVNTSVVFGTYVYGESLGLKILNTPLIIGLNWLLLVYMTASVSEMLNAAAAVKTVAGTLLMLLYDFVIEQVAPALDMWYWQEGQVPLLNYLSWFVLALFFHAVVQKSNIILFNRLAPYMLLCQTAFFIALYFILT